MENKKDFQNRIIIFLLAVIVVLLLSRSGEGRYAISSTGYKDGIAILDTKTSKLWIRTIAGNAYLGTNKKPKHDVIKQDFSEKNEERWE
jgi:hypothetical protein